MRGDQAHRRGLLHMTSGFIKMSAVPQLSLVSFVLHEVGKWSCEKVKRENTYDKEKFWGLNQNEVSKL